MKLEIVRSVDIDETLRPRLLAWLYQEFNTYADEIAWTIADWHVLAWEGDLLVGHVDITERTALVDGKELRLGGIGGVVTLSEWRKHGIATAAMQQTARFLRDELVAPFGLLVCDPALTPFYQKLGWQVVAGPLIFDQPVDFKPGLDQVISDGPSHKVTLEGAIMVLPCCAEDWPSGLIDLCGLPW
jgi:aminoglycoside 2'-N-acetyltransferase I